MEYSPTVRGRRLMRELTRLRQDQGLSLEVAATRLDWSKSKLYRMENGRTRITTDDLEDLLDLYGVRSPQREALIQLGRDARRRGWWTAYADIFTGSYISMEAEAASIRISTHIVPGVFQTAGYAREIIARTGPKLTPEETERKVTARLVRQEALFASANPPHIHVVLDEAALRRQVGGPESARRQLEALAGAAGRPNVTIQVLPFTAGAHAGMDGKFTILAFPDPQDPPVAYVEGLMGDVYLESDQELDLHNLAWTHLMTQALSHAKSTAMITELVLGSWWREVATKLAAGVPPPLAGVGGAPRPAWRVCCPRRRGRGAAYRVPGRGAGCPAAGFAVCPPRGAGARHAGWRVLPVSPFLPWVCVPGS